MSSPAGRSHDELSARESAVGAISSEAQAGDSSPDRTIEDELLDLIARQARRVPLPIVLASLLIAVLSWTSNRSPWPWIWLVAVILILAARWRILPRLAAAHQIPMDRRMLLASILSAINGIIQGSSSLFGLSMGPSSRAVQTLTVLGICVASVATTAGYRPIVASFLVPAVTLLALTWGLGPASPDERWVVVATAVLVVLFGGLMLALAQDFWALFLDSFLIRQQQTALNAKLSSALQQAQSANRARTRFLASASHDLRQPLHTLSLFHAALSLRLLDADSAILVKHMGAAIKGLGAQLDTLLDISKLDAGVVSARPSIVSLSGFVRRLETEMRPIAEQKELQLRASCPAEAFCRTDEILLASLAHNLIDNAIKYTRSGLVSISVFPEEGHWALYIRDTGSGIPVDEQDRIFEEFYQINNPERDRTRGLGLGLSIVRRLAQLLDIPMEMQSTVGQGTRFRLLLTRAISPLKVDDDARAEALPVGSRILVLDDEAAVRRGMQALLEAHGCVVESAATIDEALAIASSFTPDAVVADLRLRGEESGVDAILSLRESHPGLPALLVSGDTSPARLRMAHGAGIRLLTKPVEAETLCDAIAQEIK
ncbi:MAG: hybrid sensor histidine kinase/response regulator [Burkholderiaceae bacterium]